MCEPSTIGLVAASAAGATVGIVGAVQSGAAQAKIADNNAELARLQQKDALVRGEQAASIVRARGRQIESSAIASIAANAIETTTGSAAGVLASTAIATEQDAETVKANATREAWGFGQQAQNLTAQATEVRRSSILGAVGTGLSSAITIGGFAYDARTGSRNPAKGSTVVPLPSGRIK
jgi:hypothetical protein